MSFYIVPPHNGVFRIRLVSGPSGNSYWQFIEGENSGIQLKPYDETNTRQMVCIFEFIFTRSLTHDVNDFDV